MIRESVRGNLVRILDGRNGQSPIASVQRTRFNSRRPFCRSTWNEHYTNERQSHDSNRSATNAGVYEDQNSVFLGGDMTAKRTLVIRIAAIILASDSAMTLARFRPSKVRIIPTKDHPSRGSSFQRVACELSELQTAHHLRNCTANLSHQFCWHTVVCGCRVPKWTCRRTSLPLPTPCFLLAKILKPLLGSAP